MTTQTPDAVREARKIVALNSSLPPDAVNAGLFDDAPIMRCTLAALDSRAGDAGEGVRPCPHCGGPAKFITPMGEWVGKGKGHNGGAYEADRARYVCGRLYEDGPTECASWKSYDTEEQARAAWNNRPATPAPAVDAVPAGEVLKWLTDCDNLILSHSTNSDAWQVRRGSVKGELRGEGETPLAALHAAMSLSHGEGRK